MWRLLKNPPFNLWPHFFINKKTYCISPASLSRVWMSLKASAWA